MSSLRNKVLVRTRDGKVMAGYLPVSGFVAEGGVALLDPAGRLVPVALREIRTIAFVRDFNLSDRENPEGLTRTAFLARPRTEGLWLRVRFADGDTLEGLAPLDVSLADGLLADRGLFLLPPDMRSNAQRVYVPRAAMAGLEVLAVITSPSKAAKPSRAGRPTEQETLFPPDGG